MIHVMRKLSEEDSAMRQGGMKNDQGKSLRGGMRTFSTPNPHTHPHWSAVLWILLVATIEIPRNIIAREGAHCMWDGDCQTRISQ
jgi:hypothetical protein